MKKWFAGLAGKIGPVVQSILYPFLVVLWPVRRLLNTGAQPSPDEKKSVRATALSVWIQILIIAAFTVILYSLPGRLLLFLIETTGNSFSHAWMKFWCAVGGLIGWAALFFKTGMYRTWFIVLKPNHAAVLGKLLNNDRIPEKVADRLKMFNIDSLREIGPGLRGKRPDEVLADNPINLKAELLIGHDGSNPLVIYSQNDIELRMQYQMTGVALRGSLVNHIRHTDRQINQFFIGEGDRHFVSWAKGLSDDSILKVVGNLEGFSQESKKMFGGDNVVDPREDDHGTFIRDIQVVAITRSPKYQAALEKREQATVAQKTITELKDGFTPAEQEELDPNLLLLIATDQLKETDPFILLGGAGMDAAATAAILGNRGGGNRGGQRGGGGGNRGGGGGNRGGNNQGGNPT